QRRLNSTVADPTPRLSRRLNLVITQTFTQSAFVLPKPANAGGRIEPGVERSRNPRYDMGLSSQPAKRATAIGPISMIMKWRITKSCHPLRRLDVWLRHLPGVAAALHPRLYSAACSAG